MKPASIPDYLALVGDAADGSPGCRDGAPSPRRPSSRGSLHFEAIPADWHDWHVNVSSPAKLAMTFERERDRAFLFRELATLRTDVDVFQSVDELKWNGPAPSFKAMAERLDGILESGNRVMW